MKHLPAPGKPQRRLSISNNIPLTAPFSLKQPVAHCVTALMGVMEIDLKSLLHQAISYSSKEKKNEEKKKKASKQLVRIFWQDKELLSHISLCLPTLLLSCSCQQHRNSNKAQNLICTNQICRGHHITHI